MFWVVLIFMAASLLFYAILAGADFGAGALEFFIPKRQRRRHEELVNKAMGPVWEANHIWLIILIVILFNGFPKIYAQCSIYFHVPLTLMLLGIICRGCAFSFRNYDAVKDKSHRYYSKAFALSSLVTPLTFGMILGAMFFGVDPHAAGYYGKYMASWLNWPCLCVGVFVLSMFSYLASVYLIGETHEAPVKEYYFRWAQKTSIFMLMTGALVFVLAQTTAHALLKPFFTHSISLCCFVAATILTLVFWQKIRVNKRFSEWSIRLIAGAQIGLILAAWLAMLFPNVLFYADGTALSLWEAAAPPLSMAILGWSLIIGAFLFFPILFYLFKVFKSR